MPHAPVPNQHNFDALAEPHRHELQVHCYRMLGSFQEAEDLVQETFLRAWKRLDTYERRAPFRAWLYKIATNACLDTLKQRRRRGLPTTSYPPADPDKPFAPPTNEFLWLEPYPDSLMAGLTPNPEARYAAQESVRLAFLIALQALPPRQRAALILRDVLDWRAKEVAVALDTTVSAVNSALNRARTTLAQHYQTGDSFHIQPEDTSTRKLLDEYVHRWETADISGLVSLLKQDAAFAMPPSPSWYQGRAAIGQFLSGILPPVQWRLRPCRANNQPAFGLYQFDPANGHFRPFAVQVLSLSGEQISAVTTFLYPTLFAAFGLPDKVGDSAL